MKLTSLSPPGLVVNHLKGDPAERRVNAWLEGGVSPDLDAATDGAEALYVSVDVDSIDQSQAPGTAAPNPAGLDARDVQHAMRRLARCPETIAMDVVEISPPLDVNNMTANLGAMLLLNFFMGTAARRG